MIASQDGSQFEVINPYGRRWHWLCRSELTYLTDNRILLRIDRPTFRVQKGGMIDDFRADLADEPVIMANAVADTRQTSWRRLPLQIQVNACIDGLQASLIGRKIDAIYLGMLLTQFPGEWETFDQPVGSEAPLWLRRCNSDRGCNVFAVLMPMS